MRDELIIVQTQGLKGLKLNDVMSHAGGARSING